MPDKRAVDVVCDACGRRGSLSIHSKLAEAIHSHNPQDKITEILCSKCSVLREEESWSVNLGVEQ